MGIPSTGDLRGQQDTVGFASMAGQMADVWAASALPPAPEAFGPLPTPGVAGLICPHDDYRYAGRVYRRLVPLVSARTVVLVGVFHKYRSFGARDALVFDHHGAWRTPDGELRVSSLREELLRRLPAGDVLQDDAMQDREHSLEAIAYWLKHQDPSVEILPILVPAAAFERFQTLATRLGSALAEGMARRGWNLGRDVAVVISSDGIHYGADFNHVSYGPGGVETYLRAMARDRELLLGPLSGPVAAGKALSFFTAVVNPANPDEYRLPWCGRFSIPFGLLLLEATARALGAPTPRGIPVAFGSSIGFPQLPVAGLGVTAEANLFHFVSYPGVAYTVEPERAPSSGPRAKPQDDAQGQ
jgi:AmmeMemoRadiSam system protein B